MDKKVFAILGVLLLFIIAVNLMTRQYVGELKATALPTAEKPKEAVQVVSAQAMVSDRTATPKGIIVIKRFNKPVTQVEWDKYMKSLMDNTGMLETEEGRKALKKKALNPAQFEDTMRRLEEETRKVDEAYRKDPVDPMLQRRMEDLRRMKALVGVLVEKGLVDPDAPDLPGMNSPQGAGIAGR